MKRFLLVLMALMLLAGCAVQPSSETQTTTIPLTTSNELADGQKPADTGLYDPDSLIEKQTNGAVRAYPLEDVTCSGAVVMGDKLVLFETGQTSCLKTYTGEALNLAESRNFGGFLFSDSSDLKVSEKGIAYYDGNTNAVVFLDTALNETSRVSIQEKIRGIPVLSGDWNNIYYCCDDGIRAMNLQTGIPRLIREHGGTNLMVQRLCWNDQVLQCYAVDDYNGAIQYISVQDGKTLYHGEAGTNVDTAEGIYFVSRFDAYVPEYYFGTNTEEQSFLEPLDDTGEVQRLLELNGCVGIGQTEDGCRLDFYDLISGSRTSSVQLKGIYHPWEFAVDKSNRRIWFLEYHDNTQTQTLYSWDLDSSPITDGNNYTLPYSTERTPTEQGLLECRTLVKQLEQRYQGVEISIWQDALTAQPFDYAFQPEPRTAAIKKALKVLDFAMSRYPEGFFEKLASFTDSGVVRIGLVHDINGNQEYGALPSAVGLQYWFGGDPYISLCVSSVFEQTFYHELFHVMDSYINTYCDAYYDWEYLNPSGFEYDYSYAENENREDAQQYLIDDSRAFIDQYSMSFPTEDRARIMEYAMVEWSNYLFTSDTMQNKLGQLCIGIREAFDLKEYPQALPWECYLEEAAVEKAS